MNQVTISCKKINKSFGGSFSSTQVLRSVDFVVRENELVMLMGPSGSGKTTLLSIIGGLLRPDQGECIVLDKPINDLSESEKTFFRGRNIGFLFQYFNLVPTLTAVENAAIPLILNGYHHEKAYSYARELLITLELEKQLDFIPAQLSGGEQQRVSLIRSFIHTPKIILCDEPTSFLDNDRGQKIMQLLRDFQKKNLCTVIVVTHDQRILHFADRIVHISDGMLTEQSL